MHIEPVHEIGLRERPGSGDHARHSSAARAGAGLHLRREGTGSVGQDGGDKAGVEDGDESMEKLGGIALHARAVGTQRQSVERDAWPGWSAAGGRPLLGTLHPIPSWSALHAAGHRAVTISPTTPCEAAPGCAAQGPKGQGAWAVSATGGRADPNGPAARPRRSSRKDKVVTEPEPGRECSPRPAVSVIVVTHESAGDIEACLDSLRCHSPDRSHEVIVVDNASTDRTAAIVEEDYPEVRLVRSGRRRGFAANCNIGARLARGSILFLLNPDARIMPGAIDALAAYLDAHPTVTVVGPSLVYPDGSHQPSARRFPTPAVTLLRRSPLRLLWPESKGERRHLMLDIAFDAPAEVDWLLGAALSLRSSVLGSRWDGRGVSPLLRGHRPVPARGMRVGVWCSSPRPSSSTICPSSPAGASSPEPLCGT